MTEKGSIKKKKKLKKKKKPQPVTKVKMRGRPGKKMLHFVASTTRPG
jgi:hypothetical protein